MAEHGGEHKGGGKGYDPVDFVSDILPINVAREVGDPPKAVEAGAQIVIDTLGQMVMNPVNGKKGSGKKSGGEAHH